MSKVKVDATVSVNGVRGIKIDPFLVLENGAILLPEALAGSDVELEPGSGTIEFDEDFLAVANKRAERLRPVDNEE